MIAGRELDTLIAEKVMGLIITDVPFRLQDVSSDSYWTDRAADQLNLSYDSTLRVPPYSTDMRSAWAVVEHMAVGFAMNRSSEGVTEVKYILDQECIGYAEEYSAPYAICRAALQAKKREM